jgi:hypothetical protein
MNFQYLLIFNIREENEKKIYDGKYIMIYIFIKLES